ATTANTDQRCATIGGQEICKIAIQTNNVEVDDRGLIYAVDRANTGLHILELTGDARKIIESYSLRKDGGGRRGPLHGLRGMIGPLPPRSWKIRYGLVVQPG